MGAIIISILAVLAIIGIIAFTIWFVVRIPDHLEGYYGTPVIILGVIVSLVLIGMIITSVFL